MAREVSHNPALFELYGIKRETHSHHGRYFRLAVRIDLIDMPDHRGDFAAIWLMPPPRLSWWQHLCSIPHRFWTGAFWFASPAISLEATEEEEPLLIALISTESDECRLVPYPAVRAWLQAHCGWNF